MIQPTARNLYIRNVHDAQVILHAVASKKLRMIPRRLDDDERQALRPGDIYVWEQRGNNPMDVQAPDAMQRWTDGRHWGPSQARDEFLLYTEKDHPTRSSLMTRNSNLTPMRMIKQTYSAYVDGPVHRQKWHLVGYYTLDGRDHLLTIDHFPELRTIQVPSDLYTCARHGQRKHPRSQPQQPAESDGEDMPLVPLSASYPVQTPSPDSRYAASRGSGSSSPESQYELMPPTHRSQLTPLEYLESLPPPRRDPTDETALRAFRRGRAPL